MLGSKSQDESQSNLGLSKRSRDKFICAISDRSSGNVDIKDLLQSCVHKYLTNGGEICEKILHHVFLGTFSRYKNIDWVKDWALNSAEPWLLDEVGGLWSQVVCLIGVVAHCDTTFRHQLKKEWTEYRAPTSTKQTPSMDNAFEATFGTISLQRHFHAMNKHEGEAFLSILSRAGSPSMLSLLIDLGAEIDTRDGSSNPLGAAMVAGNMPTIRTLLEAGANGALALPHFIRLAAYGKEISDAEFKGRLELLLKNATPISPMSWRDPLSALIQSKRVMSSYPETPKMLLAQNVVEQGRLGAEYEKHSYEISYMYQAISQGLPHVVDALLGYGLQANSLIADQFCCGSREWEHRCDNHCVAVRSWLALAVEHGDASCVDVLVRHGADIIALDGVGISALQRANSNVSGRHNRVLAYFRSNSNPGGRRWFVTAEADVQTLAVLENAFNARFQGRENMKDYTLFRDQSAPSSSLGEDESSSFPRKFINMLLGKIMTSEQSRRLQFHLSWYKNDIPRFWPKPFHKALLVRFVYILSYAMIIIMAASAFIKWNRRIQIPSRTLLSAVALLMLAVVWGSSLMIDF